MAGKWALLNTRGQPTDDPTDFPPILLNDQRVSFKITLKIRSVAKVFLANPLIPLDEGNTHGKAVLREGMTSFEWEIDAFGDSVDEVRKMVQNLAKLASVSFNV